MTSRKTTIQTTPITKSKPRSKARSDKQQVNFRMNELDSRYLRALAKAEKKQVHDLLNEIIREHLYRNNDLIIESIVLERLSKHATS